MDPAVARLRLRRLLRQAREASGLTQTDAGKALGVSYSKLSRIEAGEGKASIPEVRELLRLYQATDLLAEAESLAWVALSGRSWTNGYRDVLTAGDTVCYGLEPAAETAHYVCVFGIPVLLCTEEAARHCATTRLADPSRVALLVEAWTRRQRLLDDPPTMRFYLEESALHRGRGTAEMRRQWEHILRVAQHPKVTVGVVPFTAGMLPSACSFTVLELADPPETLLYVEDPCSGGLVRNEAPEEVEGHRANLDWWGKHAVPVEKFADVLTEGSDR